MTEILKDAFFLSFEQEKVRDTWGKGIAVLAGAGSGKTTTLVSKCVRLIERDPHARFVAVSFTERSTRDLRSKLAMIFQSGAEGRKAHWVTTIHGLCSAIIREFPKESGFDGDETILSESEANTLWEKEVQAIWLEPLCSSINQSLDRLLNRETRDSLHALLKRVRELSCFGVLGFLKDSQDEDSRALYELSTYIVERFARIKRRQGVLDFYDLELGAEKALLDERVQETFHKRFDLVIVDEFQDTNPVQAKMIWKFARPDLSNLCVVGDPKQSIYRFRDADVGVFLEYCETLPVKQSLNGNYRSLPGIIEFVNAVCEPLFKSSEMKFEPLIPMRSAPSESISETIVRLDISDPHVLGEWIQQEVKKGVSLNEMVVLVRKIRGNENWIQSLISSGIPLTVGSGGFFWEDPRVRELVSFLRWWEYPGNSLSGATFLRAPWVGIADKLIDEWVIQDPTFRTPFFNSDHLIARRLKPFLDKNLRPGDLLLTFLDDERIEYELGAPLLNLWHRAEEMAFGGLDFHEIILEFTSCIEEKKREKEVPVPKNLGQLTVLTLHGSKGLEFSHVILIDFGEPVRTANAPLLFWDRKKGIYLGGRESEGGRDQKNPQEAQWREIEKEKNLSESKRLFYVALTRAKERLILVCPELKERKTASAMTKKGVPNVWNQDHWRGWIDGTMPFKEFYSGGENLSVSILDAPVDPPVFKKKVSKKLNLMRSRHSVTEWSLLARCPQAYVWKVLRPPAIFSEPNDFSGNEKINDSRDLGTSIHRFLEKGDFLSLQKREQEEGKDLFNSAALLEWSKTSSWMRPSQLSQGREVWVELSFEVPLFGEVLVGSMDRLIAEKEESLLHYTLIDFKVAQKKKSQKVLQQSYQIQMELYAWALSYLDPKIHSSQIKAIIVHITSESVQEVEIPLGKKDLKGLVFDALDLIDQKKDPVAIPGAYCSYCEFCIICPNAQVP